MSRTAGGAAEELVVLAALSGEIVLKSPRTRPRFERRLVDNAWAALRRRGIGCRRPRIWEARLLVEDCGGPGEYEAAASALLRVFGIHGVAVAYRVRYSGLDELAAIVEEIARDWVRGRRFAVRARRSGREPFTSLDMARVIGARLLSYSAGVDLTRPDVEVHVEARGNVAFIHRGMRRGPGGLPIGVEGRVLALFSGGLDSPLAAWMAAKRGAEVDMLHYVLASPASLHEAAAVAALLAREWLHGYTTRLYALDLRALTRLIAARVRRDYRQVVLRAAMYRIGERLAEALGYEALVTGESLGQVSSQTLRNLHALHRVVKPALPVLRPLVGMDKEEIVENMRRIGLYEAASRTREYCRLASGPVTTAARPMLLEEEYGKIADVVEELAAAPELVEARLS
jgi:thiamine biosynthesis protein ThiI